MEVVSEEECASERNKIEDKSETVERKEEVGSQKEGNDHDNDYLRNQLLSLEQSNLILQDENASLRGQIKELEDELSDRRKQIEQLQEKREQTLKEIEKLNLRSINGSLQQTSSVFLEKEKQFMR